MSGKERTNTPVFDISEPAIAPEIYLDGLIFEESNGDIVRGFGYSDRRLGDLRDHRLQVVVTFTRKNFRKMLLREFARMAVDETANAD